MTEGEWEGGEFPEGYLDRLITKLNRLASGAPPLPNSVSEAAAAIRALRARLSIEQIGISARLTSIEFASMTRYGPKCPACGGSNEDDWGYASRGPDDGHEVDCWLKAEIRRGELFSKAQTLEGPANEEVSKSGDTRVKH